MTNHPTAEAVASDVRAEMARQRKTQAELATVLGVTAHTVGRRLSGDVPFNVIELVQIGLWLGVEPRRFIARASLAAS